MSRYLLTCTCGRTLPVEIRQAGEKLACACGATLDVPALRNLRHLPLESSHDPPTKASSWGARQRIMTLACIGGSIVIGFGVWNRLTEPELPKFDPALRNKVMEKGIDELSPANAWRMAVEVYRPLAEQGFTEFEHPAAATIRSMIAQRQLVGKLLVIPAALCVLVALAAAFWPADQTRR